MLNSADAMRRWLGLFCLAVAAGMLIWGKVVLDDHLKGLSFVFYWLVCFAFTISAIVTALLDVWAMRQRTREEQARLIEKTLAEIEQDEGEDDKSAR